MMKVIDVVFRGLVVFLVVGGIVFVVMVCLICDRLSVVRRRVVLEIMKGSCVFWLCSIRFR